MPTRGLRRTSLLAALLLSACIPPTAGARQSARLAATLTPERLGQGTTIGFDIQIAAPAGQVPAALRGIEVRYPEDIGIALSGLGLATCSPATLQAAGAPGCAANSIMGHGSALAEIRLGPQLVQESALITIARAPDQEGHLALLVYAVGPNPVNTQILSPALLLPAPTPFGGRLDIEVPLIPSVPGAPDVAIVQLRATLGPQGLSYFEQVDGNTLAYRPKGLLLPNRCPRGGFPFAAELSFQDGSRTTATTTVPCPARKHRLAQTSRYSGTGSWPPFVSTARFP
jgi:hypothetical protein